MVPDDGSFEAAVEAFFIRENTAAAVAQSVETSEKADPGVRLRVAQEALVRRRRNPR